MTTQDITRLLSHVQYVPCPALGNYCWEWTGAHSSDMYGKAWLQGKTVQTHRALYEHFVAPIPPNMECDHLCYNTLCANPAHIDIVPKQVNLMRRRVYRPWPQRDPRGRMIA